MYENELTKIEKRVSSEQIQEKDQAKKPNEETIQTFKDTDNQQNIQKFSSTQEMLDELEIQEKDLDSLLEKLNFQIKNEKDLQIAYEQKPEVFNELELYKQKINEVYGNVDIQISMFWWDSPEWGISLEIQESYPIEELTELEEKFHEWYLENEYIQFIGVRAKLKVDRDVKEILREVENRFSK